MASSSGSRFSLRSRERGRALPVLLALVPFGLTNWLGFLVLARRRESVSLRRAGLAYGVAAASFLILVAAGSAGPDAEESRLLVGLGTSIGFVSWLAGIGHLVLLHVAGRREPAASVAVAAPAPVEEVSAPAPVQEVSAPAPVEELPAPEPVDEVSAPAPAEEAPAPAPVDEPPAPAPAGVRTGSIPPPGYEEHRRAQLQPAAPEPAPAVPDPEAPPPQAAAASAAVADLKSLDTRRVIARVIDGLLFFGAFRLAEGPLGLGGLFGLLASLWTFVVYFFLCEAIAGQTLGKRLLGLRVVRRDGSPATAPGVAARNVIRIFEEPVIALIALVASGRRRRQRLGDMLGGTTVGRAKGSAPPPYSRLRFVYPAVWALGALLFAQLVLMPAKRERDEEFRRNFAGAVVYMAQMQDLCSDHAQRTAGDDLTVTFVVKSLARFTDDLAKIDPPTPLVPVHDRILAAQRRVNGLSGRLYKQWLSSGDRRSVVQRYRFAIRTAWGQVWARFRSAGIDCGPYV